MASNRELTSLLRKAVVDVGGEQCWEELLFIFGRELSNAAIGTLWGIHRSNVPARLKGVLETIRVECFSRSIFQCLNEGGLHFVEPPIEIGYEPRRAIALFAIRLSSSGFFSMSNSTTRIKEFVTQQLSEQHETRRNQNLVFSVFRDRSSTKCVVDLNIATQYEKQAIELADRHQTAYWDDRNQCFKTAVSSAQG